MNDVEKLMEELDRERRELNISCGKIAKEIGRSKKTVERQFRSKKVSCSTYYTLQNGIETVLEKRKVALNKITHL